jgi:hypothetical protein
MFSAVAMGMAVAGCGGDDDKTSGAPLTWTKEPVAYVSRDLPHDRVILAQVRNRSSDPVHLVASKIVVRDASGTVLRSHGQYIAGYAHGLYGAYQRPARVEASESRRLGLDITLEPGKVAPLAVAWRLKPGSREPATVDYGEGKLTLPRRTARGH